MSPDDIMNQISQLAAAPRRFVGGRLDRHLQNARQAELVTHPKL